MWTIQLQEIRIMNVNDNRVRSRRYQRPPTAYEREGRKGGNGGGRECWQIREREDRRPIFFFFFFFPPHRLPMYIVLHSLQSKVKIDTLVDLEPPGANTKVNTLTDVRTASCEHKGSTVRGRKMYNPSGSNRHHHKRTRQRTHS